MSPIFPKECWFWEARESVLGYQVSQARTFGSRLHSSCSGFIEGEICTNWQLTEQDYNLTASGPNGTTSSHADGPEPGAGPVAPPGVSGDPVYKRGLCSAGVSAGAGVTVTIWRQPQGPTPPPFKVVLSIFVNVHLMMQMTTWTWAQFGIWNAIGVWFGSSRVVLVPKVFTGLNLFVLGVKHPSGFIKGDLHNWQLQEQDYNLTASGPNGTYRLSLSPNPSCEGEEARIRSAPSLGHPTSPPSSLLFWRDFGVSASLTCMVPYYQIDPASPCRRTFPPCGWAPPAYVGGCCTTLARTY
ncbi:Cationic amino acid transporter 3 [Camelus dromedarius]|uniref:Cationic amino acid transporter 3 n=1 Tax=Camelus dromedarius TaxID=9838 RepID=A0A5N4DTZ8_CAMDR|nr:Cationic amino acid transporter 3 [Camelus dromedarius]